MENNDGMISLDTLINKLYEGSSKIRLYEDVDFICDAYKDSPVLIPYLNRIVSGFIISTIRGDIILTINIQ